MPCIILLLWSLPEIRMELIDACGIPWGMGWYPVMLTLFSVAFVLFIYKPPLYPGGCASPLQVDEFGVHEILFFPRHREVSPLLLIKITFSAGQLLTSQGTDKQQH